MVIFLQNKIWLKYNYIPSDKSTNLICKIKIDHISGANKLNIILLVS
jgi:hypothetical protein